MSAIRFHSVNPENLKSEYQEFDNIDFVLSAKMRNLVCGSVRLNGEIDPTYPNNEGAPDPLDINVAYDGFVGSHSYVDRIDTSTDLLGNVENLSYYPRMVSSKAQATLTKDDLFNSTYVCENRAPGVTIPTHLLKGMVDRQFDDSEVLVPAFTSPLSFSLKLDFCLNSPVGGNYISFDKTGDIRVKLTLSRNISVLFGDATIGNTWLYKLKNLRLTFQTVPDNGKAMQTTLRIKSAIKTSIQSSFANVSTKVPMVCDSFWATAILQSEEDQALFNGMQNERIPNVTELQILWNDTMNQMITYSIISEEEILNNYIKAVGKVVGANNSGLNTLASNHGWGMGLSFGQLVDLSKSKLGLNITSSVQSGAPYSIYLFFSGVLTI